MFPSRTECNRRSTELACASSSRPPIGPFFVVLRHYRRVAAEWLTALFVSAPKSERGKRTVNPNERGALCSFRLSVRYPNLWRMLAQATLGGTAMQRMAAVAIGLGALTALAPI